MLVAVVIAGIAVSCSGNSKVDMQLADADNLMAQHPDSALALLELVNPEQIESKQSKAYYGLLINRARLLCDKTIAQDKWLDFSISYYTEKKDSADLSEALQLASIRSRHRLNQDSALLYLKRAVDLIPDNQKSIKSQLLTKMAYQLSRPSAGKDYISALNYSRQALGYASTADEKARALHDIGVLYSLIGKMIHVWCI